MEKNFFRRLDVPLLLIVTALGVISVIFINSSQHTGQYGDSNFAIKQVLNYIIGIILMLGMASLDTEQLKKLALPVYLTGFGSLILLKILPETQFTPVRLGAKRWYSVPGFSIQPSEFFKIALIIFIVWIVCNHNQRHLARTVETDLSLIGKVLLALVPPALVVYSQPDTGMFILYFVGTGAILLLAGMKRNVILSILAVPVTILGGLFFIYAKYPDILFGKLVPLLKTHQQERILGWLNPSEFAGEAYQTKQAGLAVGTGGLSGKGIGEATVYVPEKHTDFIFSTIAEEGGFIVASIVILLFLLLIHRIIIVALEATDVFESLICVGIVAILGFQIFWNIGMIVGVMPVKGISLPFLSYGGSSLFSNMMLIGIVLSIRKTYRKYMFSTENK